MRFRFDPDEQVQRAIRLLFERFRLDGSAYGVARYFTRHGLPLPARDVRTRALRWGPPRPTQLDRILHNPIYAGAYVYGRHEQRMGLVDGQVRRRCTRRIPPEAWPICLRDHHPAYISWDEFMANQQKLRDNRRGAAGAVDRRGAARDGEALLQGLVLCGRCGRRMDTLYSGHERRPVYQCCQLPGGDFCWSVPARAIDRAVAGLFLACITPPEIELALAVVREAERQGREVDRQWTLRLERARYDARLAERRYKAIDPDHRVVARTLEREWNDKLTELERLEREYHDVRRREADRALRRRPRSDPGAGHGPPGGLARADDHACRAEESAADGGARRHGESHRGAGASGAGASAVADRDGERLHAPAHGQVHGAGDADGRRSHCSASCTW